MAELCLMTSHGYPPGPGLVLHQEQGICRMIKDSQACLASQGTRQEILRSGSLNLGPNQPHGSWRPTSGFHGSKQFVGIDSTLRRPVLIDVQDSHPDSVLFCFGIAEQCARREKLMRLLMSGSTEVKGGEFDLSSLSDLMLLQALNFDMHQLLYTHLIYPSHEFDFQPLLDFVVDMAGSSKVTIHPDGRVSFNGTVIGMKDILSVVAEFYLSKNTTKWRKQPLLVPQFSRLKSTEAGSFLKLEAPATAPLKSPDKVKVRPSPKKKNGRKGAREQDIYRRSHFHACESLLSLMINKRRHGKTTILSLKKSGPELPELLTQFSAGIAGTGLAVLFSIICRVACGRVPFCASTFFSTGFGFGLVWLSWAVNKLRDTIVYISKNSSKLDLKEEEMMMRSVDKSLKDIYFRAATLMAVAVLRLA